MKMARYYRGHRKLMLNKHPCLNSAELYLSQAEINEILDSDVT